ncbi:triose-phosphate isomerase [Candidatus Entotheonella palauensis]|uniref:Triosephosphate isomerase n=1 Tax=Candidatus Entotheonella gemina TaxID=1429439 RepID=W4M4E9_9BACT|nr:triose-phosphate isomerase [Candidatus Entotheonella palauensis]ETX05058.1 MAG: triosephosphate isomerase [Candidatus Entotheonella gemina]
MERQPIMAANWKLHKTVAEARQFVDALKAGTTALEGVDVVVAAPFTALYAMSEQLRGTSVHLAAQDVFWERRGAFTGEISAPMLVDVGCSHVIIGHSERRQCFGETDDTVQRKVQAALAAGLGPIVCIGETLEQRQAGETFRMIETQIRAGLAGCDADEASRLVLAYEPIWAIGTGVTATPAEAQDVHRQIRHLLAELWGEAAAQGIRVQYGGSVKPDNIASLMAEADIDGALVGGASLEADSFIQILMYRG